MSTRITPSILYRTALSDVNRQRQQLAETQEKASSGLAINTPSDDPTGAGAAMLLRSAISANDQYLRNNSNANSRVTATESAIGNANDLLIRARELAIQGANGSQSDRSRIQIAREIETLHTALLSEANSDYAGGYLFAGFANDMAPFTSSGAFVDAPPGSPSVAFGGDSTPIEIAIDKHETAPVSFDGRRIFLGDADGDGSPDGNREDIFAVLADLRNALVADDQAAVGSTLDRLDRGIDQLSSERTAVGAAQTQLEAASERLKTRKVNLENQRSTVEDADFAEVISNLVRQESALQAGLQAMARLVQPTLMDFLR